MSKVRLYLDTSIISYLNQPDTPEKEAVTNKFWEIIRTGVYDLYISDTTIQEINKCKEPKKSHMYEWLTEIKYSLILNNDEIDSLVEKILELNILINKSIDDCHHIASALIANCDYILSWNFKHLVNIKTVKGIRAIANLQGYKQIDIVTPEYFVHEGDLL